MRNSSDDYYIFGECQTGYYKISNFMDDAIKEFQLLKQENIALQIMIKDFNVLKQLKG